MLRVFPHADMHLALNNANSIPFHVFSVFNNANSFSLTDVTTTCTVRFLAPHNAVGSRLEQFVNINLNAQTITATKVGTNLVVVERGGEYIVVRIQVHQDILAWWFGNQKITVPLDVLHATSQPSIYAMFSDDATGTDRVGDITGHGLVTLTSNNLARFTIDHTNGVGRLKGVAEGGATLNGSFLAINDSVAVNVVDYGKTRDLLVPVRAGDLANAASRHNMLFLAEGFTAAEEEKFNGIVTTIANDLFTKPRHEPFGTLSSGFNVFKAFTPSEDQLITCGFRVSDNAVAAQGKGVPIPDDLGATAGKYNVAELVTRVGLPMRGEARNEAQLKTLWGTQSLFDFNPARVDGHVVDAWKNSHSLGILEARDTFFGMIYGSRWADQTFSAGAALAATPNDDNSAALQALVRRAYEFYSVPLVARLIIMDPRRNAPERFISGTENRDAPFMTFLGGLRLKDPPNQALGSGWVPDGSFKPSRGLVAIIVNDTIHGGANLNTNTAVSTSINSATALAASYVANANANIKRLRRDVPNNFPPSLGAVVNVIAHEFGHSFNLGDEYEEFVETPTFKNDKLNPGDASANEFDGFDNIASLESVFNDPNFLTNASRKIDPAKLKWGVFPRIKLSARLTAPSQMSGGKLQVTIDRREAAAWEAARVANDEVHLRRVIIDARAKQLPLSTVNTDILTNLTVDSVDMTTGVVLLNGAAAPPVFPIGSSLFVPRKEGAAVKTIIEAKVFTELNNSKDPLNKDTNTTNVNREADFPRDIGDFKPPCQSSRLIGAFEGGARWTGLVYRPTGTCKMRTHDGGGGEEHGEFCYVCKWLITQRVDPGKHHVIDQKFYPVAKKNE